MKQVISICVMAAVLLAGQTVLGDDFAPPDYRGLSLSYQAEWDFGLMQGSVGNGLVPTKEDNWPDNDPAGFPFLYDKFDTHIDFDDPTDWLFYEEGGLWNPGRDASFGCQVINWVDNEPLKKLRIQITYRGDFAPTIPEITGFVYYEDGPNRIPYPHPDPGSLVLPGQFVEHVDWAAGQFYEDWIIEPNPDWEQIVVAVPMGTIVDQIVIDSISIPEPATLAVLGLGAVGLLRKRR